MFKQLLILTIILTLISGISRADIINIPEDYETIQAGIDAADQADTVLVAAGEYVENIYIWQLGISIIGNPGDLDEVIIDGNNQGSAISVADIVNGMCTINGFTIQNGSARYGGGITASNANISLKNLKITDNHADIYGGGIYLDHCDEAVIQNVEIINNSSDRGGGGIILRVSDNSVIQNSLIDDNFASDLGGGIYGYGSQNLLVMNSKITNNHTEASGGGVYAHRAVTLQNVLIAGNSAESDGGAFYVTRSNSFNLINCTIIGNTAPDGSFFANTYGCSLQVTNCIIWDVGQNPVQNPFFKISVAFSNIENGVELFNGVNDEILNWGDGNIEEDPRLVDPENGDYHLTVDSPCIDSGDPDAEFDSDGTRADMGAFSFLQRAEIFGYVLDLSNDQPLEGALVSTSYGVESITDDSGFWQISPVRVVPFDLTASMIGYIDSTHIDIQLEHEDTLSIDISMFHAELDPSIEIISTEIEIGEEEQFDFSISNRGNGALTWSSKIRYRGDAGLDPWELRQSFPFGDQLGDTRLFGVVFIDSLFYVSGSNDGTPTIYILNKDRDLLGSFVQPGDDNRGMKDLAYDGELIWGVIGDTVYGMTLDGEVETSFDAPNRPSYAITWDADREILWISGIVSNPVGMDREGNVVEGMEVRRRNLRIYGLAYFPADADNAPLYIYHKEIDTNRQTLHKHNFDTNETTFVTYLEPEAGGKPYGAFITDKFDSFSWVFISIADDIGNDRVDIWQLEANTSWALLDPIAGTLNPAAQQEMTLIIDATDLAPIDYPAELRFTHNGFGLETTIPIDLTVTSLDVDELREITAPTEYGISDVFPNPFNSTIRLNYTVPKTSHVSIKLYDITGSMVDIVANGVQNVGQHAVIWDASISPSGIYFARMESGGFSQTVKLMLMK